MSKWGIRKSIAATAVAAGMLAVSACGGAGQAAGGTEKVTIAVAGLTNLHNVPLVIADELGYYDEAGVDVELSDLQSGTKALEAVASNSADVAASFYDHTLRMQAKHQPYKAFMVLSKSPGAILAVPPAKAGTIKSVADLKGQAVGIAAPGSAEDAYFSQVLQKVGLKREDVSLVSTGTGASAVAALEGGQVSAGWMYEPAFSQFETRNKGTGILVDTRTDKGATEMFGDGGYAAETLYTKAGWLDEHGEEATKVATAVQRALKWMQEHSAEEITDVMPANLTGQDRKQYAEILQGTLPIFTKDGKMPENGYAANVKLLESSQGLTGLKPTETFTNDYLK